MKKRILSLTGTRADYGIYKPVYEAISQSSKLSLEVVAVGMHIRQEFGHTVDIVKQDGFPLVAELDTMTIEDTPKAMAEYIARTLLQTVEVLSKNKPDLFFVLGDRGEMLAGAIAAAELGIPLIHLHGGETTGTVDDMMRNAITHMAKIHLTTAEPHSEAVRRMINSSKNVHTVGAPALDTIRTFKPISKEELCTEFKLDASKPTLVFVQHPDTLEKLTPQEQLEPTLKALESFTGNIMIIGANADAGGRTMNERLQKFVDGRPNTAFAISLPHMKFLSWEACADVLVGNSSSGIIEAASFTLPAVNVGDRQKGRTRSGNTIDVPYDTQVIEDAIAKAMSPEFRTSLQTIKNAYGDGHAAERIVKILESL